MRALRSARSAPGRESLCKSLIASAMAQDLVARAAARVALERHDLPDAIAHARRALDLAPEVAGNQALIGLCLAERGDHGCARTHLEKAVALDPRQAAAHNALGLIAEEQGRFLKAEHHWVAAIEAAPSDTASLCNLSNMLLRIGRVEEAAVLIGPAADGPGSDIQVLWTAAVLSNYDPSLSPSQRFERHRHFGQALETKIASERETAPFFVPPDSDDPRRPLRLGWLSPDMRDHSVASFLLPLLEVLDSERFASTAYSLCPREDAITERFRAAVGAFVPCADLSDQELVDRVRADGIDILIDCGGLFGGGRPGALARRLAPVQITWLGYPNTTGLDAVDYRLVDRRTDPPGSERLASERLLQLEGCFVSYRSRQPCPLPERASPGANITFASFNALSKLNGDLLDVWCQLLTSVPGSRMLLKAPPLADPSVRADIEAAFGARGIDASRLDLRGRAPSQFEHLATYAEADIALDSFPYNGTTTTCEALWMGVPVVTLEGVGHPARVGASLLMAAGFPEWIARTTDEYVEIARGLGQNKTELNRLHGALRSRLDSSDLCDAHGFARRFEDFLNHAWQECRPDAAAMAANRRRQVLPLASHE